MNMGRLLIKLIREKKTAVFDKQKIKAILIDSGRVLNVPITGIGLQHQTFYEITWKVMQPVELNSKSLII